MRALLLAALCLGACQRGKPAPPAVPDAAPSHFVVSIKRVAVRVVAWPQAAGEPPEGREIGARMWEELSQSALFELAASPGGRPVPDAAPGTARRPSYLSVDLAMGPGEKGGLRAEVIVGLHWLVEDDQLPLRSVHACEGPDKANPTEAAALLDCALGHAGRSLVAMETVRRGDPPAVVAALDDPDPAIRQVALGAIAQRDLHEAVPRLLELLKSTDPLVRDGAIGALVELREERAVKPLTDLASFDNLDMMRRIIDAVGAIGGEEARSYLELVASGHELPAVRELAESALERMKRRMPDGGT